MVDSAGKGPHNEKVSPHLQRGLLGARPVNVCADIGEVGVLVLQPHVERRRVFRELLVDRLAWEGGNSTVSADLCSTDT